MKYKIRLLPFDGQRLNYISKTAENTIKEIALAVSISRNSVRMYLLQARRKADASAKLQIHILVITTTLPIIKPYMRLPNGFYNTFPSPGMAIISRHFAIVRTNQHIVDLVDYLICYVRHPASNARNLFEYAQRKARRGELSITLLP